MMAFRDFGWMLASYVALQIAWTLLIRTFPDFIGGALLKGVERRNAITIEKFKDGLSQKTQGEIERVRAEYATLRSSVEFMSASQQEVRVKMIDSVERLWGILRRLGEEFGPIIHMDTVFLASEIDEAIRLGNQPHITQAVEQFRPYAAGAMKMRNAGAIEAEADRLFVSSKLWLLFFVIRALYGRAAILIRTSFQEKKYNDWRGDGLLNQLLGEVVAESIIKGAEEQATQGLQVLIWHMESEFIAEAARIMSGVHSFADNISQLQTALIMEKEKLAAQQQAKPSY